MTFDYDLFVIGGGSGGVRASRMAALAGAKVALAEEWRMGGTCVIRGCIPKKLLVYASQFSENVMDAAGYGWDFGQARFECFQFFARLQQHLRLDLEFGAGHDVEAREPGREHRAHVLLDVFRGAVFDRLPDAAGEIVECFAVQHGRTLGDLKIPCGTDATSLAKIAARARQPFGGGCAGHPMRHRAALPHSRAVAFRRAPLRRILATINAANDVENALNLL